MAGAMVLGLAAGDRFTLEWTHSVERETWRETWEIVTPDGSPEKRLHLVEAAVKGSGAGMEPGPGGHFEAGWWIWVPDLAPVRELVLAASGETPSAWTLCAAKCVQLGAHAEAPLHIAPCAS
ncbi:hypothetical protein PSAL_034680 [Pseudooceanicola algae]|uniref:DUF1850 domain-containing protein n=2 Tax=Pseudooceanicola algae TaxID=1537215 RepID=A0A418SJZ3_9RHOB|nr:hypothetical protein PSAL_034680 [Pseudooceanicola algae]